MLPTLSDLQLSSISTSWFKAKDGIQDDCQIKLFKNVYQILCGIQY